VDDSPRHFLAELADSVRAAAPRPVFLIAEDHRNLRQLITPPREGGWGLDAVWADDFHHQLRCRLVRDREGYFADYCGSTEEIAATVRNGWFYAGQYSVYQGAPRGTDPSGIALPQFVICLQNHDQIGNRAFGERLTTLAEPAALEAAIALQLLCPQIPLIFMGEEEASLAPFLFFTDHNRDLARSVREGRRREFAGFGKFSDPESVAKIPDPNAIETFERSKPAAHPTCGGTRQALYRRLLALRTAEIVPRLEGASALDARALGPAAVVARWRMGDSSVLVLACNLGTMPAAISEQTQKLLFATSKAAASAAQVGTLQSHSTVAFLGPQ
jgi:malto-oligosyltrehalose trehalohydrolase